MIGYKTAAWSYNMPFEIRQAMDVSLEDQCTGFA